MAENEMTELLKDMAKEKYHTRPANKLRKKISKIMVLNELEQEKAKGLKESLKETLAYINSDPLGNNQVRIFENMEEFKDYFKDKSKLQKFLGVLKGVGGVLLMGLKLGVKGPQLAKLLLDKKEIRADIESVSGLKELLEKYMAQDRKNNKGMNRQEYMDHIAYPDYNDHNKLMDDIEKLVKKNEKAAEKAARNQSMPVINSDDVQQIIDENNNMEKGRAV